MAANASTGVGSGRNNYRTPDWLREAIVRAFEPDYDAAADHDNAVCLTYSTMAGTFRRPLGLYGIPMEPEHTDAADGIALPWKGRRVFFNPPYSSAENPCRYPCAKKRCEKRGWHTDVPLAGIETFAAKAARERNDADLIVGVLPDSRDTAWWAEHVEPYADDFPIGRVSFVDPDTGREAKQPPGGTAIVLWLPDWLNRRARGRAAA